MISTLLLYELSLFSLAGLLLSFLYQRSPQAYAERDAVALGVSLLLVKLFLGCTLSGLFTVLKINGPAIYGIVAVGGILLGILQSRRLINLWPDAPIDKLDIIGSRAFIVTAAALCAMLVPMWEVDSLYISTSILDWIANRSSVFTIIYDYCAFWELGYIPAIIFGKGLHYTWIISLEAIFFAALAAQVFARSVALSKRTSWLIALSALAFPLFWYSGSGLSTLKNDMVSNAGLLIVLTYGVMLLQRNRLECIEIIALVLGGAFLITKYSGATQLVAVLFTVVILGLAYRKKIFKSLGGILLIAVPVLAVTSGSYYIQSLIVNGNPFYPVQIHLGSIVLPGLHDLRGTEIMKHLGEKATWPLLFDMPLRNLHNGALNFLMLGLTCLVFVVNLARMAVGKLDCTGAFLTLSIALLVYLFFGSYYSAGATADDIFYLASQGSIRYVSALFILMNVTLAYAYKDHLWGKRIIDCILGLDILGKLGAVLFVLPIGAYDFALKAASPALRWFAVNMAWAGFAILLARKIASPVLRVFILLLSFIVMTADMPQIVRTKRKLSNVIMSDVVSSTLPYAQKDTIGQIFNSPALEALKITAHENPYYARGSQLQFTPVPLHLEDLSPKTSPYYVVFLNDPNAPALDKKAIDALDKAFAKAAYRRIGLQTHSALYERNKEE